MLALCGGGGYALTTGVQWASHQLTALATPPWLSKTKDPGTERLARTATKTSGPLTVTILSVRVNQQVTMVKVNARNSGTDVIELPTFESAQLTIADGTLKADPAGESSINVPAQGQATGTVVFNGVLPDGPGQVVLSFNEIFILGFPTGPRSISVTFDVTG